ncbi:hypothetical protein CAC42_2737 [Sphaceloma murrayae]|uniref:Uncharacterized protein n=1 Tax=Sphaceloma murrayae TaxID=2082308 RepID=A0A2K1R0K7_9PEZI|nr:hypothetical protein CAC42_2737 [Sphaceloma murrayae]
MSLPSITTFLPFPFPQISLATILLVLLVLTYFLCSFTELSTVRKVYASSHTYARFIWNCFFKPHTGDSTGSQQDALESFYKSQAGIYDATRSRLLDGRENMLGLVAAQVKWQMRSGQLGHRPIWVDVGGGTGWNIEQMGRYLDVERCFHAVYLVDFSPSLCEVAKARFKRLGWGNVKVVCQDARTFRLAEYEAGIGEDKAVFSIGGSVLEEEKKVYADVLTMSYSLSMIPEFHPVIDSLANLVAPNGILGVVDFYVQSQVEFQSRNYMGGIIDRHCMWISRVFWRTWFEADRVNLEAARRDYLEYKFGTILSTNARNHFFGFRIPYYIWIGCAKQTKSSMQNLARIDAAVTESPFISALDVQQKKNNNNNNARRSSSLERHSKAYESAIINLAASLPLPSAWYQQHHWRVYYDEQLQKHKQFGDEYIYAFTWEDARADARILNITSDDVILAITSAGDNILSYALERPKRIHAVDLNPNQNHLLELKVAAFTALPYQDVWKLFGEGKHPDFTSLLVNHLSPHLSTQAFDYWLHKGPAVFSSASGGLYFTGGSRHALNLVQWLGRLLGITHDLQALATAPTLAEQREIWSKRVRRVLLSRLLAYTVVGTERFLWKALGVPQAQRDMIESDFLATQDAVSETDVLTSTSPPASPARSPATVPSSPEFTPDRTRDALRAHDPATGIKSGQAIWEYGVQTLDPVAQQSLLSEDNHYYALCLLGRYTPRCHPSYLSPKSHVKLSHKSAFDGLRIHTDELAEVLGRMSEGTLTIAVLMDSMDWFDPRGEEAGRQVSVVRRALKMGGRVLLRSAGLTPWYIRRFEEGGFSCKRVAARGLPGTMVDRVNMYASTWVCTKV